MASASESDVMDLGPVQLAPLYHVLTGTAAPAPVDAGAIQALAGRGADVLRDALYRVRVRVQLAAGADGLEVEPALGPPALQTVVDDIAYELRITAPAATLRIAPAEAAALADRLAPGRATAADLLIQLDGAEQTTEGRRVISATLREAAVLGVDDGAVVHRIAVSPLRPPPAPAAVPPPGPPSPAAVAETPAATAPTPAVAVPPPPAVAETPSAAAPAPPTATAPAPPAVTETPAVAAPTPPAATTTPPAPASPPSTPAPVPSPPSQPAPLPTTTPPPLGPPLMERLDTMMAANRGGDVRATPAPNGALLFVLSPGASVFVTGRVSPEWMQLRLIDGSFGYLEAAAFTQAPIANPLPPSSALAGGAGPAASVAPTGAAGAGLAPAPSPPAAMPPGAPTPPVAPPAATGLPGAVVGGAMPGPVPSPAAPSLPVTPGAPTAAAAPPAPAVPMPAPVTTPPAAQSSSSPAPAPAPVPPPPALAEPVVVAERAGVLRNEAAARALQVAQIRPGQRFTLIRELRGADGQSWAEVKPLDGAPGFVPRKDLVTAAEWDAPVVGAVTRVVDAATLVVGARTIKLGAVDPGPVRFLDIVRPWLSGAASPLTCERRADAAFDCFSADRRDVGETMILNGLARAGAGAPAYYVEAQDKAREGRKGLWRTAR